MEPLSCERSGIQSRIQQIRGCAQAWARCLASARTIEEALAVVPAFSKARLNLRAALENALKEEWSSTAAATAAALGFQTPRDPEAWLPEALRDWCAIKKESSTAAASIKNTHPVEDSLWKEVFYKPYAMAKRLKRPTSWNSKDVAVVRTYLEEGIDYYRSLLDFFTKLQSPTSCRSKTTTCVFIRCLCCLGDLARYNCVDLSPKLPLQLGTSQYMCPAQYYSTVLKLSPDAALAHSNLASVMRTVHNSPLQAALHYLAALRCSQFEGARVLLKQLLDECVCKYSTYYESDQSYRQRQPQSSLEGHFLHTVLATVSCFAGREEVSHVEVNAICQDFLVQLGKRLQRRAGYSAPSGDRHQLAHGGGKGRSETELLVAALLVAAHKVQTPQQGSTCAVLLASVLLTLVSQCQSALQHTITSLHSEDVLLALTTARPQPPLGVAKTEPGSSSSGDRAGSANRRTKDDREAAAGGGQKKRPVARRRRRLRRGLQATNGYSNSSDSDDSSSSEQEHFSPDHSDWSSDESSVASGEDSCSSEEDSGEDVIIESDDEVAEQSSILCNKDQKGVPSSTTTTPAPASQSSCAVSPTPQAGTHEPLEAGNIDSTCPIALSAMEHLKLIAISDGGETPQSSSLSLHQQEQPKTFQPSLIPNMKATSVDSNIDLPPLPTAPSSLLAVVSVLVAWLRVESKAKNTMVWCDVQRDSNDLRGEGDPVNGDSSGNEDDAANGRGGLPEGGPVPNGVGGDGVNRSAGKGDESSRVLWKVLAEYCNLTRVDLQQLCSMDNLNQLLPNLKEFVLKMSASMPDLNCAMLDCDRFFLPEDEFLMSTVPWVVPKHSRPDNLQFPFNHHSSFMLGSRSNGLPPTNTQDVPGKNPKLNTFEECLLRNCRIRQNLSILCTLDECPLRYCDETGLFSVLPRSGDVPSSGSSSTAGSGSNNNHKPYYLKKVSFGGYVMDKVVRRRTRPHPSERRSNYSSRETGEQSRQEHRRRPRKNRQQRNGGGGRNLYREGEQDYPSEKTYTRRDDHYGSEEMSRSGGRHGPRHQNKRREDRYPNRMLTTDDSVKGLPRISLELNRDVVEYVGRASSAGSPVSAAVSPVNHSEGATESYGLEDLKDAPLISPDTTTSINGKFGAIGDRRKAAIAVAAGDTYKGGSEALPSTGKTFGEGPVMPRTCESGVGAAESEADKKSRRDHSQRLLTARWLRHKLDTTDCKPLMYLVPDATAIIYHLEVIKTIVHQRQTIVVVPLQVLSDIDDAKRGESAARDASRWLDRALQGRNSRVQRNSSLRVQGASERTAVPGVQSPPKHHKVACRWFQILECCHHLSRLEYFPKEEEAPIPKAGARGVGGSLYSDKHQQPVLKNKHKSNLSQQEKPAVVESSVSSLLFKIQDDHLLDRAAVVTLLTGETGDTIGKLPFQLRSLASRVAAKLVLVADYKKAQNLSHGQT